MFLLTRTATAVVAALALTVPTAVVTTQSASGVSAAHAPVSLKGKSAMALKRSAAYSHVGQPGVKVTAVLKKSAKGKVSFSVNGAKVAKEKLKKGKASYTLPATNGPGKYQVTAKYKGAKKSTKVHVYNSAISLSATSFTVSKENYTDGPPMTGSVLFKDKPASTGWVDIYQDGRNKGGVSSPYYCCDAEVLGDGTFTFTPLGFLGRVAGDQQPGTYSYQVFYTDDAGFDDYIYSTPITVVVTP